MAVHFYTKEVVLTHSQAVTLEDIELGSFSISRSILPAEMLCQIAWSISGIFSLGIT